MDCLWITLADPEPATNGQLIYSKGLIESVHAAGASLCVLGLPRPERDSARTDEADLVWRLTEEQKLPRWKRLLHPKPEVALRGVSQTMSHVLERTLGERDWGAIVFDSICTGWALEAVLKHCARCACPPSIVYLAHNHEATVARRIADASRGLRRIVKEVDFLKARRLERRLIAAADLVTANTPDDCKTFMAEANGTPVAFLPPGYGGSRVDARRIDASVPRRAVVVGSFDWPPKRISVERFLAAASSPLARAGVELQFVGAVEPAYLENLRTRYPSVAFVGPVDDVRPYMSDARIALVPDLLGGFKLKGLDYVFNRIPIMAMRVALPGMPLEDGYSIDYFDSHEALAEGVVTLIDDFETLNQRHSAAIEACATRFDWHCIGERLLAHIEKCGARRVSPPVHSGSAVSESAAD